jgi:hypothetical protein
MMNEKRKRTDLYYFDRLDDTAALYPDGTVGELESRKRQMQVERPSRRPDRQRLVKITMPELVRVAVFNSLPEYVDYKQKDINYDDGYVNGWSIDDMPDETIAAFNEWRESLDMPTEQQIVDAAYPLIASDKESENAVTLCPTCEGEGPTYEGFCQSCGYARTFYKYPLVRLHDSGADYDVPLDVSKAVAWNPHVLTFENNTRFDQEGGMAVQVEAVVHTDRLPPAYIGGIGVESPKIGPSDKLSRGIRLPIAVWREEGSRAGFRISKFYSADPEQLLPALQHQAALSAHERTDIAKYQDMYDAFIDKLRTLGRAAMVRRRSHFGDMDIELSISSSADDLLEFKPVAAGSITIEETIEDVFERMNRLKPNDSQ